MEDILLVDDDRDILHLVRNLLETEGMTVRCAETGEEALCELREKTFHLLITDLNLPGLDGFALASKASSLAPRMPIIMITGNLSSMIPSLAMEAGITTILAKPFHANELLEAVRETRKPASTA